eukprot:Awhi_evm1s4671
MIGACLSAVLFLMAAKFDWSTPPGTSMGNAYITTIVAAIALLILTPIVLAVACKGGSRNNNNRVAPGKEDSMAP